MGPGVWNGWKGQLLRELYYAAENMMTGGDQSPGAQPACGGRQGGRWKRGWAISAGASARSALSRHYDNYWLAFEQDEHERHARLLAKADAER